MGRLRKSSFVDQFECAMRAGKHAEQEMAAKRCDLPNSYRKHRLEV